MDVQGIVFHFTTDQLGEYVKPGSSEEPLTDKERELVGKHLESCAECRYWAGDMEFESVLDDEFLEQLSARMDLSALDNCPSPIQEPDGTWVNQCGKNAGERIVSFSNGIWAKCPPNSEEWTAVHTQVHLIGEGQSAEAAAESLIEQVKGLYEDLLAYQGKTGWHITVDKAFVDFYGQEWLDAFCHLERFDAWFRRQIREDMANE